MRALWRSTTLRSAAVLGFSGVGFAVANLVLARALPTEEYAVLTLVVALVNVGYPMAAAGVDGMVNRRRLEAGPRLLRRLMQASIPVALVAPQAHSQAPAISGAPRPCPRRSGSMETLSS